MTLRELGRRMVERGAFDEVEDFGMLRKAEFDDFLADPKAFTNTIRARREPVRELQALDPPFVFVGEPDFPAAMDAPRRRARSRRLEPGDVAHRLVRVPRRRRGPRPRDPRLVTIPTALEPGDVLVAPITDPSWTPLFVPACAVVVDVGALQSHAIIVSRELGIPCVVSVTGGDEGDPRRCAGAGRRLDRNGHGPLMAERVTRALDRRHSFRARSTRSTHGRTRARSCPTRSRRSRRRWGSRPRASSAGATRT